MYSIRRWNAEQKKKTKFDQSGAKRLETDGKTPTKETNEKKHSATSGHYCMVLLVLVLIVVYTLHRTGGHNPHAHVAFSAGGVVAPLPLIVNLHGGVGRDA